MARPGTDRLLGRLVTGPAAFLAAGLVDWALLLGAHLRARRRSR